MAERVHCYLCRLLLSLGTFSHAEADFTTIMHATIPNAIAGTSAVWTGQYAYIFGGIDASNNMLNQIARYNPMLDQVQVMNGTLAIPRELASAV